MDVWKNCIPGDLLQPDIESKLFSDIDKFKPEFLTVYPVCVEQPESALHAVFIDGSVPVRIRPACFFQKRFRTFHVSCLRLVKHCIFIEPRHLFKSGC